jgi:hypothetical protein
MINTQITSIRPYRLHNQWVFDSDRHGLIEEAFVCGMTEIIDEVLHDNDIDPDTVADKGFRLTFSAKPWPESTHCLKWDREEYDGNSLLRYSERRRTNAGLVMPCIVPLL